MDLNSCQKALDQAKSEAAYHQSTAAYIRNERRHIQDRLMAAQADPTNPAVSEFFLIRTSQRSFPNVLLLASQYLKFVSNLASVSVKNQPTSTMSQCPRTDFIKRSLPRPKTTTAWKLMPHIVLKSARIEILHIGFH